MFRRHQGVHQTDKQALKKRLVCLSKLQSFVCSRNTLSVCLDCLLRHIQGSEGYFLTKCILYYPPRIPHRLRIRVGFDDHTMPSANQLRKSCCTPANSYKVRGRSLFNELPAVENFLSLSAALAGIAKHSKARCLRRGSCV